MNKPTHLFFDVDGVLINGFNANPATRTRWDKNLKRDLGLDPISFQKVFFGAPFKEAILGKCDVSVPLKKALQQLESQVTPQELLDYWFKNDSNLNQAVLNLVKNLRATGKYELFIATNQEHKRANYLWQTLGFKDYFEDIFHSAKVGITKDEPEYFHKVAKLINQSSENILLIDDTAGVIAAAQEAGWQTFHLTVPSETAGLENLFFK